MNLVSLFGQFLFIALSYFLCSDKHLKPDGLSLLVNYKQKNVGAYICLFDNQAYHSLEENRQRNTHVEVYKYTVKCAYEDTRILAAHYGV